MGGSQEVSYTVVIIGKIGKSDTEKAGRNWLIFKIKDPVQTADHKGIQKRNYITM